MRHKLALHCRSEDPFTLHEGYSVCLDDKMAPEAGRSAEERSLHAGESTATMMSFRVVKPHHEYDTPVKVRHGTHNMTATAASPVVQQRPHSQSVGVGLPPRPASPAHPSSTSQCSPATPCSPSQNQSPSPCMSTHGLLSAVTFAKRTHRCACEHTLM